MGIAYPTPSNQCWPGGVPYVFWNFGIQLLQLPDKVTIIYFYDNDFRQIRMNERHPEPCCRPGTAIRSAGTKATC